MHRHGMEVDLIKYGYWLLKNTTPDELGLLENEINSYKQLMSEKIFIQKENSNIEESKSSISSNKIVRVYVDGCYDLMHAGHYNSIRQAKKLGDVLVWGVNSDDEIEAVKGPTVFKGDERWIIVDAWKWTDEIAPDTLYSPTIELLEQLNWEFFAHGDDISLNANGEDFASVLKRAGRFRMFKRTRGVSTTDIASKILKINDEEIESILEDEEKEDTDITKQKLPEILGSFNTNPNFLASAKRIANFANTKEPLESDRIVYVDGSFDVCHPGHIELLKKARELGDFLIVGIHDDQTVNQYLGKHFPLNTLHERVLNILACKYVDDVIIGAPFKITDRLLRDLNVSIVVKSLDLIQGSINSYALALNPYEVPEKLDIIKDVNIECTITVKEIIRRVQKNKEAIEKKVIKYAARQNDYESNATYVQEL